MADRRPQVRRGHERLVEVRLLAEQAERESAPPVDRPAVGLVAAGDDPQQRRLARAVGPDEADPLAGGDRRRDLVEDDEGADLADDAVEPDEAHAPDPSSPGPRPGPGSPVPAPGQPARRPPPAGRRPPPSCAPSARAPSPPRPAVRPSAPSPSRSTQRRPRRPSGRTTRSRRHGRQELRRPGPVRRREPLAERAEVRGPDADHDPPDRAAAAPARLPRPLVDVEALLHLAVAVGRRVVVDRRCRGARRPRPGSRARCGTARARRAGGGTRRTAAGGASSARAPRRRRCCRRRPRSDWSTSSGFRRARRPRIRRRNARSVNRGSSGSGPMPSNGSSSAAYSPTRPNLRMSRKRISRPSSSMRARRS